MITILQILGIIALVIIGVLLAAWAKGIFR